MRGAARGLSPPKSHAPTNYRRRLLRLSDPWALYGFDGWISPFVEGVLHSAVSSSLSIIISTTAPAEGRALFGCILRTRPDAVPVREVQGSCYVALAGRLGRPISQSHAA